MEALNEAQDAFDKHLFALQNEYPEITIEDRIKEAKINLQVSSANKLLQISLTFWKTERNRLDRVSQQILSLNQAEKYLYVNERQTSSERMAPDVIRMEFARLKYEQKKRENKWRDAQFLLDLHQGNYKQA